MPARRYLLIGTGVAAIAAAQAIRSQDPQGDVLLVGDEREGYYSRPGLAYVLTGELTESQLYPFQKADFQRLRLRRLLARAIRLDPQAHQVVLHDGTILVYDRLLVATGSRAARLQLPGAELEGVIKLDNLEDARGLLKLARRARTAVVVGGGITALEIVEGLLARKVKTHYFMRGERYWSNVLDATESRIVEQRVRERGLQIHRHTEIGEILGERGRVVGVRTRDGRVVKCEILAVAIGVLPRIELAQTAGLHTDRGILVDEHLQTSAADVFAAGDVAQVFDPASGRSVLDSLWTPARQQGAVAGMNMCGQRLVYRKAVPFNVTRLAEITTTVIGTVGRGVDQDLQAIARGDSETWRQLPDAMTAGLAAEINRLRVIVGQHTLLGAIIMGDQTLSRPLQHIIADQVDITPVRQELLQPDAPIAAILSDFWTKVSQNYDRSTQ